jgi:hypothetical protein
MMHTPPRGTPTGGIPRRWAYSYVILPPQPTAKLTAIRAMLALEHKEAKSRQETWRGQVVVEPLATGILVVADSPDQKKAINRNVEQALQEMSTGFALSTPQALDDGTGSPDAPATPDVPPGT